MFEFIRKKHDALNDSISDTENDTENIIVLLSATEQDVLKAIKDNNSVTRLQLSKIVNKSEATVQRAISTLVKGNYIKRVGSNKRGYWKILE